MQFDFISSPHIVFGEGKIAAVAELLPDLGNKPFIVTGNPERAEVLFKQLSMPFETFVVQSEPTIDMVNQATEKARASQSDCLIAFGGGSVIDTAKAIAALMTNSDKESGDVLDYLEVVGKGLPLQNPALPVLAIPTTSGTGAEVTKNAVLSVEEQKRKVSLRHKSMIPKIVIVDPELTYSCPSDVTACAGLDALTQLIEAYTSNKANPMTDALCIEGIKRAGRSLEKVVVDGGDKGARADLSLASLFSGMALANAKLGAVHGFAGVLGGLTGASHGAICAALLPYATEVNIESMQGVTSYEETLERYKTVESILQTSNDETLVERLLYLNKSLAIPRLSQLNLTKDDFEEVVSQSKHSSSMKGNPIQLSDDALLEILNKAF